MGRSQAGEGGHHIAAVCVRHLIGHILGILGRIDQAHLIPEPLDGGSRHENGTFQGIIYLSVQPPGNGSEQPIVREDRFLTSIHKKEASCSVGILGLAGPEAGLSKES